MSGPHTMVMRQDGWTVLLDGRPVSEPTRDMHAANIEADRLNAEHEREAVGAPAPAAPRTVTAPGETYSAGGHERTPGVFARTGRLASIETRRDALVLAELLNEHLRADPEEELLMRLVASDAERAEFRSELARALSLEREPRRGEEGPDALRRLFDALRERLAAVEAERDSLRDQQERVNELGRDDGWESATSAGETVESLRDAVLEFIEGVVNEFGACDGNVVAGIVRELAALASRAPDDDARTLHEYALTERERDEARTELDRLRSSHDALVAAARAVLEHYDGRYVPDECRRVFAALRDALPADPEPELPPCDYCSTSTLIQSVRQEDGGEDLYRVVCPSADCEACGPWTQSGRAAFDAYTRRAGSAS